MNRAETLRILIEQSGNHLKCRDIWERRDGLALKTTQAASELREKLAEEWKTVEYHKEETPSDSWYSIEVFSVPKVFDPKSGQGEFATSEFQGMWK